MDADRHRGITYTDEGEGRAVVLIHGFPLSRGMWAPQVDALKGSHRVIAPDLRGFGESPPRRVATSRVVSMENHADDIARLLDDLGVSSAIVAGHSMGGYVALAFARRHAERLDGLVLVATRAVADSAEAAAGRRATAERIRAEGREGVAALVEGMVPKLVAPGTDDPDRLEAVRVFMASATPEGVIGALLGMAERPDSSDLLAEIEAPALVVTGADDTLIPVSESEAMALAIPDAELAVIPGAGHMVSFEHPEEFDGVVRDWLASRDLT
ncbi:MAG: alpha/beta hydrolase [Thermoanaerobaculia bacterium]|nr:alpha/beta hydrolase [Thermoanaerobaculia bacterium]